MHERVTRAQQNMIHFEGFLVWFNCEQQSLDGLTNKYYVEEVACQSCSYWIRQNERGGHKEQGVMCLKTQDCFSWFLF